MNNIKATRNILFLFVILALTACSTISAANVDARAQEIAISLIKAHPVKPVVPTSTPKVVVVPYGSSHEDLTKTPATENATPEGQKEIATATARPAGPSGQKLRLAYTEFSSIDPALAYTDEQWVASEAFVGLTRQDETTQEVKPGLAESWEVSDNGASWTFHLRKGIPWVTYNALAGEVEQVRDLSGKVRYVTAGDVAYGIKRVLNPDTSSGNAYILDPIQGATDYNSGSGSVDAVGITTVDDTTLVISLKAPNRAIEVIADLPVMAAVPAWQIDEFKDKWTETGNFQAYGPFVLREWNHNQSLTLVRNPFWPGTPDIPVPTFDEVTWNLTDNSIALDNYKSGQLDLLNASWSDRTAILADAKLQNQLVTSQAGCNSWLAFNTSQPPLDKPEIRKALSMALDREKLANQLSAYSYQAAAGFVPPVGRAAPDYQAAGVAALSFKPGEARRLLAQAYPDLSSMPPLTLTLVNTTSGQNQILADALTAMWQTNLGITVKTKMLATYADLYSLISSGSAPQIYRVGWCMDYGDAYSFYSALTEPGDLQIKNWFNSGFTQALSEAAAAPDSQTRAKFHAQVDDILINQDAIIIPLLWTLRQQLSNPDLQRTFSPVVFYERFEKWYFK